MKTLIALPFALLVSGAFIAPAAQAEPKYETFQVSFVYNATDPAEQTYSRLEAVARRACSNAGVPVVDKRSSTRTCTRNVIDQAVALIARADIARLHSERSGR